MSSRWKVLAVAAGWLIVGCGGGDAKSPADAPGVDLDGDPVALLPGDALILANVDAKAFYASQSFATQAALVVDKLLPIGEESGFVPSRDVERVVVAAYSTQGADAAAIVKGHFEDGKIAQAAQSHTATRTGGQLSTSTYLGHTVYLVGGAEFVVLTSKTALAGTEAGVRRTLEKIKDNKVKRTFAPWMVDTIETKGAEVALAADFAGQPVASAAIGAVPLTFFNGMHALRVIGNFKEPGMHVAATITYGDASQASSAADQLKMADSITRTLGLLLAAAPQVQNLEITPQDKDVQVKAQIDDQSLRKLFGMAPQWINPAH